MFETHDITLHGSFNIKPSLRFNIRAEWYANTKTPYLQISSKKTSPFIDHTIMLPPMIQNNNYLLNLYANPNRHQELKKELSIFFNAVVLQAGPSYLKVRAVARKTGRAKPIELPLGIPSFEKLVDKVAEEILNDWEKKLGNERLTTMTQTPTSPQTFVQQFD